MPTECRVNYPIQNSLLSLFDQIWSELFSDASAIVSRSLFLFLSDSANDSSQRGRRGVYHNRSQYYQINPDPSGPWSIKDILVMISLLFVQA